MNLINDPWIPVQHRDGTTKLIKPWQLTVTENPVVALDTVRPDFNAALLQFLIGLLQTAASPTTEEEWVDWLETPNSRRLERSLYSLFIRIRPAGSPWIFHAGF